jgi:hypothetical protein
MMMRARLEVALGSTPVVAVDDQFTCRESFMYGFGQELLSNLRALAPTTGVHRGAFTYDDAFLAAVFEPRAEQIVCKAVVYFPSNVPYDEHLQRLVATASRIYPTVNVSANTVQGAGLSARALATRPVLVLEGDAAVLPLWWWLTAIVRAYARYMQRGLEMDGGVNVGDLFMRLEFDGDTWAEDSDASYAAQLFDGLIANNGDSVPAWKYLVSLTGPVLTHHRCETAQFAALKWDGDSEEEEY